MMNQAYMQISDYQLIITSVLMLLVLALSYFNRARLEKDILVGSVRCFVQLMLVGYLLKAIFQADKWYWVILAISIMLLIAGVEAVRREKKKAPRTYLYATFSIAFATVFVMSITVTLILDIKPWYNPQYMIPMMGMLIGNAMNGSSLMINRLHSDISSNRQIIESKLSLGATARQASEMYVREAIKASMIPTINFLMVTGIVSLPGMMTGQIIAGASPLDSVRYQIAIMYMISAANALTVFILGLISCNQYFSASHQLKQELLNES